MAQPKRRRDVVTVAHSPRLGLLLLIVLPALLIAAPGAAQDTPADAVTFVPVDTQGTARPGGSTELVWEAVSGDSRRVFALVAEVQGPARHNWDLTISPPQASLEPGGRVEIRVLVSPDPRPTPRTVDLTVTVLAVNGTSTVLRLDGSGSVQAIGTELVLGTWENPLPPPLDNAAGAFLANVVAWLILSLLVMWLIDPTLKAATMWTKTDVDDHIIQILRRPAFVVLFTFGIKQSLEVFALPTWAFTILDRMWSVVLVAAIVYTSYRVWQEIVLLIGRRVAAKTESKLDDRLLPVLEKVGGLIILVIGVFYIIDSFGVDLTLFAAGGVLVSMVIAFAAQDTLSNFFSGVHLLLDQPFKEGDWIVLDSGELTTVSKIGLRSTHLYHIANHESIIVPNNLLATNRIINILKPDTRSKVRVDVGVAYGTDVQRVKSILLDIAKKHPLALDDPDHQPFIRFQNFGASSLDFSLHFWVKEVLTRWAAASDAREMIDRRFAEEGIEIPFPQRVIWNGREEQERAKPTRSILDHPKVRRSTAGDQPGLSGETGAEPEGSGPAT